MAPSRTPQWGNPALTLSVLAMVGVGAMGALLGGCPARKPDPSPADKTVPAKGTTAPRPAWIDNPHALKPEATFLAAVGQGRDRAQAADQARAEVARKIEVSVKADRTLQENLRIGPDEFFSRQTIDEVVRTRTEATLQGLSVDPCHEDAAAGQVWCLAALDRAATRALLHDRVVELDREIARYLDEANAAIGGARAKRPDSLTALKYLGLAEARARERAALDVTAKVIAGEGFPPPAGTEPGTLRAAMNAALRATRVYLALESGPDTGNTIASALVELLGKTGMAMAPEPGAAHIVITGAVRDDGVEETRIGGATVHIARASLSLTIVNPANDATVGAIVIAEKEGGSSPAEGKRASIQKLRKKLLAEFSKTFQTFLAQ